MAPQPRKILGPVNPFDNGVQANYVDGGDDSLASRDYVAPLGVTDQDSDATRAERTGLTSAFREAQAASSAIGGDAGAGGLAIARGTDDFHTEGGTPGAYGLAIGDEPPVVTRNDGSANLDDAGPGQAIG